jgi:hypothetical protein
MGCCATKLPEGLEFKLEYSPAHSSVSPPENTLSIGDVFHDLSLMSKPEGQTLQTAETEITAIEGRSPVSVTRIHSAFLGLWD